jgi:hypothetical protein
MANKKAKPLITFPPDKRLVKGILYSANPELLREAEAKRVEDDFRRLVVLARHYGIDTKDFRHMTYELALVMARELYPELKQPGQKKKWTGLKLGCLVVEMERLIRPNSRTYGIKYAAETLAKKEPWKSFVKGGQAAEMLRTTYTKHRKDKWAEMMRRSYQHCRETGTVHEWEQDVSQYVSHSLSE